MRTLPAASVDLTVTSPPYDNLRTYNDSLNDWNAAKWQSIIAELFRVTKDGSTKPMSKAILIPEHGQRFNIWQINPQRQVGGHPAPFPLALANDHIASWSNPGDVVLDPFLGSGTTGVAALQSGRRFIGIERDPDYFAICQQRINGAAPRIVVDMEAYRRFQQWNALAAEFMARRA